ncbi:sensor histidine kinase [Rhodobacteraceae bacterium CCMM004]|nr:sensor histidine kinase [Rhodobacteraceae bacterium CCMM004]
MDGHKRARGWAVAAFFTAVAAVAAGVWWWSWLSALDRLEERGRGDLSLAGDRLVSQLQQYRELAVLLADHPVLAALAEGAADTRAAAALLLDVADKTGSHDLALAAADGHVLASAQGTRQSAAGPALDRALQGALGADHRLGGGVGGRVYQFAAPVFGPGGGIRGAVLVDVDLWRVEAAWRGAPEALFFTDTAGVVFVTNRGELLLRRRGTGAVGPGHGYAEGDLRPFFDVVPSFHGRHEVWRIDAGRYLPQRALHLTLPLPVIGMTGEVLLDVAPAARIAGLQAVAAAAVCLVFGAALFLASERRRRLSDRLAIEAAANARLEARVAERTRALRAANADLRREVAEREEAQTALTAAQAGLVQAGKLSALGQMSAGISHELNQPLMAIRSFAENGAAFIDRGQPQVARDNLDRIAEMARRMGRIIKNLRAFARQEREGVSDVDLVAVVAAALEMAAPRAAQAGATLDWTPPDAPIWVRGGEVRLQQVVLNLVANAIDATETAARRRVRVALAPGDPVRLTVRDTGPGIADPDRIFDPFYTTKEVGRSEGMGLGLSISYGLIQSFGGEIRGENAPGGGAVFVVDLQPAVREAAA